MMPIQLTKHLAHLLTALSEVLLFLCFCCFVIWFSDKMRLRVNRSPQLQKLVSKLKTHLGQA